MIIGIAGVARCGKDTFYKFAKEFLDSQNLLSERYAFADELKRELEKFVYEFYGLDIWTDVTADKEIFRPLMVAHGSIQRKRTGGGYWIDKLFKHIYEPEKDYHFITDCRHANEADRVHDFGGKVIHITRWNTNNFIDFKEEYHPANSEEAKNDPLVKEKSDFLFSWNDFNGEEDKAKKQVAEFIKKVI